MTPAQQLAAVRGVRRVLAEAEITITGRTAADLVDVVERIAGSCGACAGTGIIPSGRYVKGRGYLHRPCEICQREREDEARYDAASGIGAPS